MLIDRRGEVHKKVYEARAARCSLLAACVLGENVLWKTFLSLTILVASRRSSLRLFFRCAWFPLSCVTAEQKPGRNRFHSPFIFFELEGNEKFFIHKN